MSYEIMMFGEKPPILGSKSHVVVFHHFISPTLSYNVGDDIGVVEVCFTR